MKIILLAFVWLLSISRLLAEVTPEECVKAYYSAVAKDGLTKTLDLIHPDDLKVFRKHAEQFQGRFPINRAADNPPQKIAEKAENDALSDREWAARTMPLLERMQESVLQLKKSSELETVGHVVDGDLRYVVIRWRIKIIGTEVVKLAVAPTKLYQGRLMMLMPEELMQMASLLGAQANFRMDDMKRPDSQPTPK